MSSLSKLADRKLAGSLMQELQHQAATGALGKFSDITKIVNRVAALSPNAVNSMLELQKSADEFVARMSAHESKPIRDRFVAILHEIDSGSSVANRLGSKRVEELKAEQIKASERQLTVSARRALTMAENRLAEWVGGNAQKDVNPGTILRALETHMAIEGFHPTNKEYAAVYQKLNKAFKDYNKGRSSLTEDPSALKGLDFSEIDSMVGALVADGVPTLQALNHTNVAAAIGYNGAPPKIQRLLESTLKTGSADDFVTARAAINSAMQIGRTLPTKIIKDPIAKNILVATRNDSGKEAIERRSLIIDKLERTEGASKRYSNGRKRLMQRLVV